MVIGFLQGVVQWVLIPAILLSGLLLAVQLAKSIHDDDDNKVATYAGLLAGLVAGSGFAITQLATARARSEPDPTFHFNIWAVVIGLALGVGLPFGLVAAQRAPRLLGVLTLLLSGSSSLALLSYLFAGATRDFVMLLAVSLLFGVLICVAVEPKLFRGMRILFRVRAHNHTTSGSGGRSGAPGGSSGPPPGYGQPSGQ